VKKPIRGDYYVYVYIDPRNHEEFYYGKGQGGRKNAHLRSASRSVKDRRIDAIRRAGLTPSIRVIARGLSEHDALLVEKTLLWRLGKSLTNVSKGHYAKKFRPHDTMHEWLEGFDYRRGVYYYNVGDGRHRNWDDYLRFGFIAGGHGPRWRKAMLGFQPGDIVVAYLKRAGFVGIGRVLASAKPVREVQIKGRPLLAHKKLRCAGMAEDVESDDLCEYVARVKWIRKRSRAEALWKAGLYRTPLLRASLDKQRRTLSFLERGFGVKFEALLKRK
jgi:hypothetical protein